MIIDLKNLVDELSYIEFKDNSILDTEKNSIVFGANGIGKTTIYHRMKDSFPDFDYLDYEETKDIYKKQKKEIIVSIGIKKIEELRSKEELINNNLQVKTLLKDKGITSSSKAKAISNLLKNKYDNKELSEISIDSKDITEIEDIKDYVEFSLKNYCTLKNIGDLTEELKLVDKNYLKKALTMLEEKMDDGEEYCPVCGSKVPSLKLTIQRKIKELSLIQNKCLLDFIKLNEGNDIQIEEEFKKVVEKVSSIDELKLVEYYIINGEIEKLESITRNLIEKKKVASQIEKYVKRQNELYDSLMHRKTLYTDYLINNFDANVVLDDKEKSIKIILPRNADTYSTGELNVIMFITKIFSFLGNEKNVMVIDDPISSYDIVNQYHICFHLCKIINKNIPKRIIVFTHNADVVNIINSQNDKIYDYFIFDKVNGQNIMNSIPSSLKKGGGSILNIKQLIKEGNDIRNTYISLLYDRDDSDPNDLLSGIMHYDGLEFTVDEGHPKYDSNYQKYLGCTNMYFVNYIVNETYKVDVQDFSFENLSKTKIILLTAIRIWLEYKLNEVSQSSIRGSVYSEKVNSFFKLNPNISTRFPNLSKENLMNKKVMLNQNCHLNSQIQPFYYALSISYDDISREINELKQLFS